MEYRNQQPGSGTNHGNLSVVPSESGGKQAAPSSFLTHIVDNLYRDTRTGEVIDITEHASASRRHERQELSPEKLADILDEPHTRRAWWLDLHSSKEIFTGTTITDIEAAVSRAHSPANGSNGQPAAAPVSFVTESCDCSAALTMPVCECSQPVASLRPFDWLCAKCKGVIPSRNLEAR